jgi:hypothetical protein
MSHNATRIPHRPAVWSCSCGSEWRGDCKTCPLVRLRNNFMRKKARKMARK